MKDFLQQLDRFEKSKPLIVFEWNDAETEAVGWLVINSLRGNAAGGGTRMRKGLNFDEVVSLAKTMEIKFSICGPQIGGAKSGLNFDPNDPRKTGVLKRWYTAILPLLKNYYGTGGDLNISEAETNKLTSKLGVIHPQEGIARAHFKLSEKDIKPRLKQLQITERLASAKKYIPENGGKHTLSDLATGYGIYQAINCYYKNFNDNILDKKVIVQGCGVVGAIAALYLARVGAKIVAIIDKENGLICEDGIGYKRICNLLKTKVNNLMCEDAGLIPYSKAKIKLRTTKADIFVPAAASGLISADDVNNLLTNNVRLICCGANVPFKDKNTLYGSTHQEADARISVIPDFIANCGTAILFNTLMSKNLNNPSDNLIFSNIERTIKKAISDVCKENKNKKTLLSKTAYAIALDKLV